VLNEAKSRRKAGLKAVWSLGFGKSKKMPGFMPGVFLWL